MFKVVSAEMKKMVSKPGIYVLAILLALILVLGVFIYKPTVYQDTSQNIQGETVLDIYNQFDGGSNAGIKYSVDDNIVKASIPVTLYRINGSSYKDYINELYSKFETNFSAFRNCAYDSSSSNTINTNRTNLLQSLTDLNYAINTGINNAQNGAYTILTTNSNFDTFEEYYDYVYDNFDVSVNESNRTIIAEMCKEYEDNFKEKFVGSINNFKYPTISDDFIKDYSSNTEGTKYFTINSRMQDILADIYELRDSAQSNSDTNQSISSKDEMTRLINLYVNTANTFINLVNYELLSNAFSVVNTNDQLDLMYLNNQSEYNSNSLLIRYTYLFENGKTENDFAHPLTIGVTSNHEINAYDYAYFILKLFSFIIIVYAVMTACHSIAGEIKEGSMRYLAIRPVGRTKLFFGKLLAVLMMSIIMIVFSAIVALCVGGTVYGFDSLTILTIFNGSTAITMHPIVMLLIYLVSLFFELAVYASIAMLLSCLFKSDLFAVTIMLVLYLLNTLLPVFAGGINSWLTYYPFSHISIYSLFGSSNYALSDNFLNILLGAKVYAGTNIGLTVCVILLFIIIANVIGSIIFKKKEL